MSSFFDRPWYSQPFPDARVASEYSDAWLLYSLASSPGSSFSGLTFPDRRALGWGNVAPRGIALAGWFANDVPPTVHLGDGIALDFDGTRKLQGNNTNGQNDQPPETLLIKWRFTSVSGTQALIGWLSNFGSVITTYGRGIVLDGGSIKAVGSANNSRVITGPTAEVGKDYVIAVRFGSSGAMAINGEIVASGNLGSAWNYRFGIGAGLGGGESTEVWNASGYCSLAYAVRRGLDNGQLMALTANPWQLFEPEPLHIYWPGAGGGAAEGSGEGDIVVGAVGSGAASEGAGTGTVALGGVGAGAAAEGAGAGDVELAATGAGAAAEGAGAADVAVGGAGTGQASEGAGEADVTLGGAGAGEDTAGQGAGVGDVSLGGVGVGAAAEGAGTGDVTLDGNGAGDAIVAPEGSGVGNLALGGSGGGAAAEGAGEADIALGAEGAGEAAPSTFGTVRVFDLAAHRCAVSTSSNKCAVVTAAAFRCDIQTAIAA
jgi:hypothetical protein